jgi:uncharacterized protein (TIGR04255 family)
MTEEDLMSRSGSFYIDRDRDFPHLAHAPIVEAVIHWQASPGKSLDREEWKTELTRRFGGYSLHVQQHVEAALSASAEGVETHQRTRWGGFRLTGADDKYVCQVTPNAVVFSRLAPYENWASFVAEALRFWDSFGEIAAPVTVDRLGVRFINQMEMKSEESASEFVNETPELLESIGLHPDTFFRQDILEVPDQPYRVNLVRAIQGPQPPLVPQRSLIVDIDAFTTGPTKVDKTVIEQRLKELRFLKNLVFFKFIREPEKRFGGMS